MKKFLSDYGFTILAAIVVITLITFSSPIGSAIQKQTANTVQSLGKVANNDLNKIDDSASLIDLTNINKSGVVGDFSRKGNLVTINGTQYRVLDVNGTQIKVMSMESVNNLVFNPYNPDNSTYANSTIDTYLNEDYYNSLTDSIRNAIVEQNINQSIYSQGSGINANANFSSWRKNLFTYSDTYGDNYHIFRLGENSVGSRKVYALDVDDVIAYLGSTSTPQDLVEMFWNQRNSTSYIASTGEGSIHLRSNGGDTDYYVFCLTGSNGDLSYRYYYYYGEVRPAFVLDLSLLS